MIPGSWMSTFQTDFTELIRQIYANYVEASVLRPLKELKAFNKVMLNAEETQTVTFEILIVELAFFDDVNMNWKLEVGQFKLMVGFSSQDIKKVIEIDVE